VPEEVELFSTFGGNPVACAAALAVLAVIEDEGLVASAAETGSYLRQGLEALAGRHPVIGDVRVRACCSASSWSMRSACPRRAGAGRLTEAMRERGILISATGPAGNSAEEIRPPLVFRREHADLLPGDPRPGPRQPRAAAPLRTVTAAPLRTGDRSAAQDPHQDG
jgi:4-aminobutyrate aminotransferase-like enzyme